MSDSQGWLKKIILTITSVGRNVEKLKASCVDWEIVKLFSYIGRQQGPYDDLNDNGIHGLICLKDWFPVSGTVWEGLGECVTGGGL